MKYEGRLVAREWRARTTRIDVGYDVVVQGPAGEIAAEVVNVSSQGFRLRSEQPLEAGWEVSVSLHEAEPVRAVIRWSVGLDLGGVFVEPVAL
jgi:hypothetical protein